ncbi:MAG: tRNA pseudouridine(38-40) synthase TruA [Pseudomonadota bacterium]
MRRYRLTVEYDGTPFVGWQKQSNGMSVQESIERAIFQFCGEVTNVFSAGRTDAGVHARQMTAHFDIEKDTTADVVRDALNHYLRPKPVAVLSAQQVTNDFHARFSAKARHYEYLYCDRRAPLALDAGRAWRISGALDHVAMHEAAQALIGQHDFTTFRAAGCQAKSPIKTLDRIAVRRVDDTLISLNVSATSFLHHQVRSIAGSLFAVGIGKWHKNKIADILAHKDRSACGQVAPPYGLYFLYADY